jgi:hypothetical protein
VTPNPFARRRTLPPMTLRRRRILAVSGGATLALAGLIVAVARGQSSAPPGPSAPAGSGGPTPSAAPSTSNSPQIETQTEAPTTAPNVRIVFKVVPPNNATVHWGNKRLGLIKPKAPLIIERPRDSGPLDVVVKSAGYVTVHTRAYTFTNTVVAVKLTPVDKKNTIYGYREEAPPAPDGGVLTPTPDGGVPPPPAPPSPPPAP